jgi:hypothetical protein
MDRPIKEIVRALGHVSGFWLEKNNLFRQKALRRLVEKSGYSQPMAEALLDSLFSELTAFKLLELLREELGNPLYLDGFQPAGKNRLVMAKGPKIITHIFAENVPNPAILSFIFGLLVKSRNVLKVSSRDAGFLDIYLESLKKYVPKLAEGTVYLKPEDRISLDEWIGRSNLVVAYGSNETLNEIEKKIPQTASFQRYGHKVSFGIYLKEAMKKNHLKSLVKNSARDVWMMDQRGCLSPTTFYIQEGGQVSALDFAKNLAEELDGLPHGASRNMSIKTKNLLNVKRLKDRVRFFESSESGWLVIYDGSGHSLEFKTEDCRIIYVKSFQKKEAIFNGVVQAFKIYNQAVSVEASFSDRQKIAKELGNWGVNRVCRAGKMQEPPLFWHHDGKANFASWIHWVDLEK